MKNLLVRRITILISIAILISSILIASLGLFLSEEIKTDNKGKDVISNLSVAIQCTMQFKKGNIDKEIYESILMKSSEKQKNEYMIFDSDKKPIFTSNGFVDIYIKEIIDNSLVDVLRGNEFSKELNELTNEQAILVGVPIIENNSIEGAIFVLSDKMNYLPERKRIIQTLIISMIIVIPFIVGLSYLVLRRIVKPIKNVVSVALAMVKGDFSIRADENLEGQIGLLGRTINKLSVELYKNISQLYIERNRLHQVLNSLEEGMIAVDENKRITHYNKVFLDMFSLTMEDINDKCIDDIDVINNELYELTQAIEGKYSIMKNCTHDDIILRIVIASIEDDKNNAVGAVVLFRDITELENLETMRRDYVANVSHELRSPLTSIRGLIEPLMDSIVSNEEDVKRYYKIIYKESLRLSRLVDDIMELSRLQTNDSIIQKTSIDLGSILEMVYERYKMIDEDIKLIYNRVQLPMVFSNYDRIEQILVILLDNAYKFTPKGGEIEIITTVRTNDILVTIKDTGVGISENDLPFVFNRFYKSDKSRTKRGSGLGLSIAKEILDIMGEKINVKSKIGLGSSFEITIHLEEI